MRIPITFAVLWIASYWAGAAELNDTTPNQNQNPPSESNGECLYNGIILPEVWPPNYNFPDKYPKETVPMPVPYLKSHPEVVPIDIGRQLFVDDFLIESTSLKRTYHRPKKYKGNPILKCETELEQGRGNNKEAMCKGGLWWDPAEQIFKMWYDAGWINTICYATSKDGLTWDRPSLDVNPGTNQVLSSDILPDTWTVVLDLETKNLQQRYKLFMTAFRAAGPMRDESGPFRGVCMTSSDGIHWTNRAETGGQGDCSNMFYNPFRKKWVYSLRSGFYGSSRHYREADDFLAGAKWEWFDTRSGAPTNPNQPVPWATADRDDPKDSVVQLTPMIYNLNAVAYESIMLGSFDIWRGPYNDVCNTMGLPKIVEPNFAYSRDGFHWYRPDRRASIPAERRDVWDRGYVRSLHNLCCVRGDMLWFYYGAFQGDANRTHCPEFKNGMYCNGSTGIAFLRRDGFASMDADATAGTLTTRPVRFSGSRLFVNVNSPQGELRAEILDEAGQPIAPFTLDKCRPVQADSTLQEIVWNDKEDLADLQGKTVRFRFTLQQGSLYAFWVSRDASGRSDGYVAGGGPGFTGPTDTVGRAALEAEAKLGVSKEAKKIKDQRN